MARPETPETDKLQKVYNEHPDVQEFLQWLLEGGMIPRISKVETIARYYKIDLSKAAEETRAYLEYYQTHPTPVSYTHLTLPTTPYV